MAAIDCRFRAVLFAWQTPAGIAYGHRGRTSFSLSFANSLGAGLSGPCSTANVPGITFPALQSENVTVTLILPGPIL
jgi:hypothetical protein